MAAVDEQPAFSNGRPGRGLRARRLALSLLLVTAGAGAPDGWAQSNGGPGAEIEVLVDSANAALVAGELQLARRLAERAVESGPKDPRALIALGRVHLEWPRIGRFQALELFRRAARLAPDDPEPGYWIGRTGLALLGDDGEMIARRGLERTLALDPLYRDAWDLWRQLYRSPENRLHMVELLRPHAALPEVAARIAQLLMEADACGAADSLLARLESEFADPRWPAWRAECAFIQERDAEGWEHYGRALEIAALDTAGVLWAQVTSIARPDERATYVALPAAARGDFFRAFWAPRDPNVRTPENERVGEHFRRRAEARDRYRILHPLSLYHYSLEYRDRISNTSGKERQAYVAAQLERGRNIVEALTATPGLTAGERMVTAFQPDRPSPELERLMDLDVGFKKPDREGISPDILPLGRNLADMVDDRGMIFIRHGPPDRIDFRTLDAEEWAYEGGPPLRLRFDTGWYPPDQPIPDMIHRPMTARQARSVGIAVTSDRSSLPAPLEFGFWFARFRQVDQPARTALILIPEADLAASAVLWDGAGRELARADRSGAEPLRLASPPGRLLLALDVERADSLGRYRGIVELPDFSGDTLALSDVLVTGALDVRGLDREEAAAAAIPSLSLRHDRPFAIYAEAYGLAVEGGVHRFLVTYELKRQRGWLARLLGGGKRIALQFERVIQAREGGVTVEALRVNAGDVAPGRYSLSVQVRDLVAGRVSVSRTIEIELTG
ncbi:MAG: GWxTD domain-containing protein [Gemmatimonadota bacterium]|nr:MAG: GWxTD domain-containing protein [Gemmatimonadota bacterium]